MVMGQKGSDWWWGRKVVMVMGQKGSSGWWWGRKVVMVMGQKVVVVGGGAER